VREGQGGGGGGAEEEGKDIEKISTKRRKHIISRAGKPNGLACGCVCVCCFLLASFLLYPLRHTYFTVSHTHTNTHILSYIIPSFLIFSYT
jgi:hypothetical protein